MVHQTSAQSGYFVVTQTVQVYSMVRPLFAPAPVSVAGGPHQVTGHINHPMLR